MQSLFGFVTSAEIEIALTDEHKRKLIESKGDKVSHPLYFDGESVSGKVQIRLKDGRKLEHQGIKIEFIGQIQLFYDRGNHYEFLSLTQELSAPGDLREAATFDFDFKNVEKSFESYHGINAKLKYVVKVTIERRMSAIVSEKEIWVYSYKMPSDINDSIKMEVGIEDCLHIEFEYNKAK